MLWYVAVATLIDYAAAVKQHPSVVYAINAGGAKVVDTDLGKWSWKKKVLSAAAFFDMKTADMYACNHF